MKDKCLSDQVIQNYIEGLLTPAESRRVKEHLDQCDHCRKQHAQFSFIFKGLEQVEFPEPPADFTINTLRYIHRERTRKLRRRVFTGAIGIAASFLVILLVSSTNLLMLLGIDLQPLARAIVELRHDSMILISYLSGIFRVLTVLFSGFKGGQLLNSVFWGSLAVLFIIFLKLRDKFRIFQHVIG